MRLPGLAAFITLAMCQCVAQCKAWKEEKEKPTSSLMQLQPDHIGLKVCVHSSSKQDVMLKYDYFTGARPFFGVPSPTASILLVPIL